MLSMDITNNHQSFRVSWNFEKYIIYESSLCIKNSSSISSLLTYSSLEYSDFISRQGQRKSFWIPKNLAPIIISRLHGGNSTKERERERERKKKPRDTSVNIKHRGRAWDVTVVSGISEAARSSIPREGRGIRRCPRVKSIINLETASLPGPRSSLTCSAHSTQCAMSKYGNIFSLMTWLAMSRNASGSIAITPMFHALDLDEQQTLPRALLRVSSASDSNVRWQAPASDASYALSAASVPSSARLTQPRSEIK